ncbi:MAG: hypothetical protein HQM08_17400 [Candidatus Riflebacteria bacterium]|nr:hypothetical protein [Candidatus Riflebacteria bacterium]
MKTYKVISPLKHDGKAFKIGSSVEMSEEEAKKLIKIQVLEETPVSSPEPGEKKKK